MPKHRKLKSSDFSNQEELSKNTKSRRNRNVSKNIIQKNRRLVDPDKGRCVFEALLNGVIGLDSSTNSHEGVLKKIRMKVRNEQLHEVNFCGHPLTPIELDDCLQALENIQIRNGYLCAALDPLLTLTCAVFNVDIIHEYVYSTFEFQVASPRRIIYLNSNSYHMFHVKNENIR